MAEPFNIDELAAGDILLYRSNTWIARAIRLLDGTEVSHAGLYLGDGVVAEALAAGEHAGLDTQPVVDSVEGSNWVAVRRMKPTPGPMTPVLNVARMYLDQGNRYAYGQILLLAGICLTRKLDCGNGLLRRIARTAFDMSTSLLEKFRREGKEPMICSEFVFRTYDEAVPEPDDPYSLEIPSQAADEPRRRFSRFRHRRGLFDGETQPESPSLHPDSLLARLQTADETPAMLLATANKMTEGMPEPEEDLDSLVEQYLAEVEGTKAAGPPEVAAGPEVSMDDLFNSARRLTAGLAEAAARKAETEKKLHGIAEGLTEAAPQTFADIAADFVTPGDLLKSPSLVEVGMIRP